MAKGNIVPDENDVKLPRALPLDSDTFWKQLSPVDLEWLRRTFGEDERKTREWVDKIQKDSYDAIKYPCIRSYHFIRLDAIKNPIYKTIVEAGKKGETIYLDVGCCMGTDVRKLVADGYTAHRVFACDLHKEFLDFGHRLYGDASTCSIHFMAADAFHIPYPPTPTPPEAENIMTASLSELTEVRQLQGNVTHLYAGLLFHLFTEEKQYALALRLGTLVKHEPGTILYGRHVGMYEAQHIEAVNIFAHNPESWAQLWRRVFTELKGAEFAENRVVVEAEFLEVMPSELTSLGVAMPIMHWNVRIV